MEATIADLRACITLNISTVARKHGVGRSALSRRWNDISTSKHHQVVVSRAFSDEQESDLIDYIRRQSEVCLPPTLSMITNLASDLAGYRVGKNWTNRFVQRHAQILDSRYLHNLDLTRHGADSLESYEHYFNVLGEKMEDLGITAENIYNMDEKGFMMGVCNKTRRIFTKQTFEDNKLPKAGQDGNREWIALLATICADGTALSPALIYKAKSGNVRSDWLEEFDPEVHKCHFASTANGWTSDEHGMAWLEDVFDKETKVKARRSWRLLFVDGHGSHLNLKFVEKCESLKILLAFYPPHSTHRLQPLDVSCFSPLANYYSQGIDSMMMNANGLTTKA